MMLALAGSAALAAAGALHGGYHRNSPVFGRVLSRLPASDAPRVALTFDDGPNPDATPAILDVLAERGVRATFFVLGRHADRWPDLVARAVAEGHQVANHGYHHRKLHVRGPAWVRQDLEMGTTAIVNACGVTPEFFRAPHGFRSPWVVPIAASLGQRTVGWGLGVWDSDRPGADAIVRRTIDRVRSRDIVLLHDGDGYDPEGDRTQTAAALPAIIDGLRARGFSFSTLPPA